MEKMIDGRRHVLTSCINCKKELWRRPSHLGRVSFCSQGCRKEYRPRTQMVNCSNCNKEFFKREGSIKRSRSGRHFCSRSCSTAYNNSFRTRSNHYNWNGGASYRERALNHYEHRCHNENCPLTKAGVEIDVRMIDVDHIDNNRSNNDIENLQLLCVWCHAVKTRLNG